MPWTVVSLGTFEGALCKWCETTLRYIHTGKCATCARRAGAKMTTHVRLAFIHSFKRALDERWQTTWQENWNSRDQHTESYNCRKGRALRQQE
jgi:hypothetical protein